MEVYKACLYTDGACSGNPGPGGWGLVLVNFLTKQIQEHGGGAPSTTNNRMEMTAVIEGLRLAAASGLKELLILTDSTYVIRGFTQWRHGWKRRGWVTSEGQPVSNQDLWEQLDAVANSFRLEWRYVRGHQGTPGNERVDEIAVTFSKKEWISLETKAGFANYLFDVHEIPPGEPLPEMKFQSSGEKKPVFYVSYVNGVLSRHGDWASCERTVKGQAKALYKKVSSEEELEAVLKKWGVNGN
jgi:ribonuclease HI